MSSSNVASKTDLVKLRSRKTSNGRASLYLDYVQYNERVRDTLGLFLLSGKSPEVKEKNQKTMAKAELLRLEKEKELLAATPQKENADGKTLFLQYYRTLMEDRKNDLGNYGNWRSCFKYLQVYCSETTTFDDITPRWVQGFKTYLDTVEKDSFKVALKPSREGFNGLSQNSKCSYFNKLRACLNQAYKEGIIASNPADRASVSHHRGGQEDGRDQVQVPASEEGFPLRLLHRTEKERYPEAHLVRSAKIRGLYTPGLQAEEDWWPGIPRYP